MTRSEHPPTEKEKKMHDPNLLVSEQLRRQAAILRHVEKQRKSTQNRLWSLTEFPRKKDWGMGLPDDHPDVLFFADLLSQVKAKEEEAIEALVGMYLQSPLHQWSSQFKGLAPGKLCARFIGEIGDPYLQVTGHDKQGNPITEPRVRTLAQLRRLTGMSVEDGRSPRHVAGEQSGFRDQARTRLWLITDQVVKQHDERFHPVFLENREKYLAEEYRGVDLKGKPWSDERLEVVARKRARVKVGATFLRGIYEEARRLHEA